MKILIVLIFATFNLQAAVLSKISGNVLVNSLKAKGKVELSLGDTVTAKGKNSYAIIDFGEETKSIITNGSIKIEKSSNKGHELNLIKGLLSTSMKQAKNKKLQIKTKNAVLGVRGTKFLTMYGEDDTYLCVCEGTVEIKNRVSSTLVNRDEDIHVTGENQKTLVVTKANDQMWDMSVEQFKLMGLKVKPKNN
ncbi:MAG: hypothetical protein CME65_08570 [Halobacteriovoraceae bacterium]|nr:hypothetical protein [Halobacteriovoraceae bacterium]|tara:strand:+ start:987 stop:1565 length:579 start_codon:yes stop_codon:yes gene_type:complete